MTTSCHGMNLTMPISPVYDYLPIRYGHPISSCIIGTKNTLTSSQEMRNKNDLQVCTLYNQTYGTLLGSIFSKSHNFLGGSKWIFL